MAQDFKVQTKTRAVRRGFFVWRVFDWEEGLAIWRFVETGSSLDGVIAMTLAEFQSLVDLHIDKFAGVHRHSAADFDEFERALGHTLPQSLRWLLGTHGYSACCGVENLAEAVEQTIVGRDAGWLPCNWLLLNDWGDGGIVLLDMSTGRICWCGAHNAGNLADGEIDSDADWFSDYPEWTARRLEDAD